MADDYDEDIFADLYDEEPAAKGAPPPAAARPEPEPEPVAVRAERSEPTPVAPAAAAQVKEESMDDGHMSGSAWNGNGNHPPVNVKPEDDNYGPINVKEDGKMFIGGLNWETTEESLEEYFSQFGEVSECTVMRDSATGRSRGFGFLTFKDPKCVNIVMVKEHYLDGKIIDPKRAIPREEQERTSKIFVGGVSQEATEEDFKNFFKQFGRVVDATLMMDKDTGRPRGFGFVTFDGDAAVDACLQGPLQIHGKPIEVKRAQPRGNMRDDDDGKKFGRGGKFNRDGSNTNIDPAQNANANPAGGSNMSPAMLAQYWQRMQQYFHQMQQNLAAASTNPMSNQMGNMGGPMNPAMMGMMGGPNSGQMGGPMNPGMMGNFQQNAFPQMRNQGMNYGGDRPAYNAQDQMAFEQQKYEQQQARRMQQQGSYGNAHGPTSWEGMYDDIPQPSIPSGPGAHRMHGAGGNFAHGKHNRGRQGSAQPTGNAPANAPTGPKNAGKPGANYRGGGRNANYRHNPYGGRG